MGAVVPRSQIITGGNDLGLHINCTGCRLLSSHDLLSASNESMLVPLRALASLPLLSAEITELRTAATTRETQSQPIFLHEEETQEITTHT
jgi:hypothetical protein